MRCGRPHRGLRRTGCALRTAWEREPGQGRSKAGVCKAADRMPPSLPPPLDPLPDPNSLPKAAPVRGVKGWITLAGWLFLFGFGLGPPLDGFHSEVGLQSYDVGEITIGGEPYGLHTNIWVFPMLGAFYSVVGVLQLLLDRSLAKPGQLEKGSWGGMLTSLMVLVGLLRLSAQLYEDEMPYTVIFGILAICANANWYAFERTWWGYALALLVAVGAPASEVYIMRWFSLWHYSCPDLQFGGQGIVSWTSCCYFFYTQFLACLARCLETELLPEVASATSAGSKEPEQTPKA